ncbi:hypothetical protein HY030_00340 [Candidatus Gottesmanbacteria bacterium]|nr:hypothetical protein [Candidatus Gottesmanbacteria bacterium]
MRKLNRQFFLILLLLLLLPFLIFGAQVVIKIIGRATGTPANIIVDYNSNLGPVPKVWQALAQGGEEKGRVLSAVISDTRKLSPSYIRLDHLYDMYEVVKKNSDIGIGYDFTKLDQTVDDILTTGALPFFSLSYMPLDFSDDVVGKPRDWSKWRDLVRATIEHYSGRGQGQKNLDHVYYEVWNEPDLFGKWKTYGGKNYLELYGQTVQGARSARNINNFQIGGPATTGMYESWMQDLLKYAERNNLRLDFLSYHRYSRNSIDFAEDLRVLQNLLNNFPAFINLPIIVSEWGSEAGNSSWHDGNFDAVQAVAAIRQLIDRAALAFTFEIKDGPGSKKYWGRWGLITHDKFGLEKKPKYYALELLNNLSGQRIRVEGEGSFVTAIAAKDKKTLKLILVNYDPNQNHAEDVPITFNNLPQANFSLKTSFLFGKKQEEYLQTNNHNFFKTVNMPAQTITLLELTELSPSFSFALGFHGYPGNLGLSLNTSDLELKFSKEQFSLPYEGFLEFFLKPLWESEDQKEIALFDVPLGEGRTFSLRKKTVGFSKRLEFGTYKNGVSENTVSSSISSFEKGKWHHVAVSWGKNGLNLFLDGIATKTLVPIDFSLSGELTFHNFGGVIDELRVLNKSQEGVIVPTEPYNPDTNTVLLRHFDQSVDN